MNIPNNWIPARKVLEVIEGRWSWMRNSRCKYIELRIDTRDGCCLIRDRNGNPITLEELQHQYSDE